MENIEVSRLDLEVFPLELIELSSGYLDDVSLLALSLCAKSCISLFKFDEFEFLDLMALCAETGAIEQLKWLVSYFCPRRNINVEDPSGVDFLNEKIKKTLFFRAAEYKQKEFLQWFGEKAQFTGLTSIALLTNGDLSFAKWLLTQEERLYPLSESAEYEIVEAALLSGRLDFLDFYSKSRSLSLLPLDRQRKVWLVDSAVKKWPQKDSLRCLEAFLSIPGINSNEFIDDIFVHGCSYGLKEIIEYGRVNGANIHSVSCALDLLNYSDASLLRFLFENRERYQYRLNVGDYFAANAIEFAAKYGTLEKLELLCAKSDVIGLADIFRDKLMITCLLNPDPGVWRFCHEKLGGELLPACYISACNNPNREEAWSFLRDKNVPLDELDPAAMLMDCRSFDAVEFLVSRFKKSSFRRIALEDTIVWMVQSSHISEDYPKVVPYLVRELLPDYWYPSSELRKSVDSLIQGNYLDFLSLLRDRGFEFTEENKELAYKTGRKTMRKALGLQ